MEFYYRQGLAFTFELDPVLDAKKVMIVPSKYQLSITIIWLGKIISESLQKFFDTLLFQRMQVTYQQVLNLVCFNLTKKKPKAEIMIKVQIITSLQLEKYFFKHSLKIKEISFENIAVG